ncbi:hypothetical protein Tsubulata_035394 [Turnera subulata]|uniref:BAG domain-containing protein n=1 Tax=Turnera subulata TaxID=218843 RepID=A0A9Q0J230_9ROSI|nr:hypothetical protein Tsubulata_035394 [Turnera subulata]
MAYYKNNNPTPRGIPVNSESERVSIPVQYYAGSVKAARSRWESESDSAVKIQKLFRGFMVRKSVRKIREIGKEVDEVERKINKSSRVQSSMGEDPKERVKVNEELMRLLFKLDSVPGVDSGVRTFRKAVINKAIALQETVEAEAAARVEDCGIEAECCSSCEIGDLGKDGGDDGSRRTEELMERVRRSNKEMKEMMGVLIERNLMQGRLLKELSWRVEQLERAYLEERLRRMKMRAGGAMELLELGLGGDITVGECGFVMV